MKGVSELMIKQLSAALLAAVAVFGMNGLPAAATTNPYGYNLSYGEDASSLYGTRDVYLDEDSEEAELDAVTVDEYGMCTGLADCESASHTPYCRNKPRYRPRCGHKPRPHPRPKPRKPSWKKHPRNLSSLL